MAAPPSATVEKDHAGLKLELQMEKVWQGEGGREMKRKGHTHICSGSSFLPSSHLFFILVKYLEYPLSVRHLASLREETHSREKKTFPLALFSLGNK